MWNLFGVCVMVIQLASFSLRPQLLEGRNHGASVLVSGCSVTGVCDGIRAVPLRSRAQGPGVPEAQAWRGAGSETEWSGG